LTKTNAFKDRLDTLFSEIQDSEENPFNPPVPAVVYFESPIIDDVQDGDPQPEVTLASYEMNPHFKDSLPSILQTLEYNDQTTVGSLHLQNFCVSANGQSAEIDQAFHDHPDLVGAIVMDAGPTPRIISRGKYYEMLGKLFGVSVFLNRSIRTMLEVLKASTLVVEAGSRIAETVQRALQRPSDEVFEPVLIAFPGGAFFLLDIYVLFQAQMKLLVWLQQQIQLDNLKLEKRVERRTAQLSHANASLEAEIGERRRAQEKLDIRLLYEKTLTLCANSLLTQGDSHEVIQDTLTHLQEAVDVSRVFILEDVFTDEIGPGLRLANQVHVADAQEIPPKFTLLPHKMFGDWLQNLWKGKSIIGQIDELEPGERKVMWDLGLTSVLLIPIGEPGNWNGVIGFGENTRKRQWDENDIELLRTVAQMLHSYYQRELNGRDLAQARDEAMQASKFKSELLAKVSHELRTPLGAILGYAQLLQAGSYGAVNDDQRQAAEIVISSSKYLTTLVNGILDQAQLDKGQLNLVRLPFRLKKVAEEVEGRLRVLAESKGLDFVIEFGPNVPEEITGDRLRLEQVLTNLLDNAIKFTDQGFVKIKFSVSDANRLVIQVSDSGQGIPEDAQAKIFEEFVQVDGSATRKQGGTGLGLSISKQLVEMMKGRLTLTSILGEGTIFAIDLPIIPVDRSRKST